MKIIDNAKLVEMFKGGYKNLKANKAYVDSLNVFPVPDGDTGSNMTLTMASAIKEIEAVTSDDRSDILTAYARGALRGARGNSGVILSQIVKGISTVLNDEEDINTKTLSKAFLNAREIAYNAVTKPKEGTVLTVIRYMAEQAPGIANKTSSVETFFEQIIKQGDIILQKTPDMLPVLKQAGVVDAGGRGLLYVVEGWLKALKGEEIPEEEATVSVEAPSLDAFGTSRDDANDYNNITFQYCTEFFVTHLKKHVTEEDIEKLREKLMTIGDCVIAIGDINFIKVHVHTNQPNKALYWALQLGELDKVKIENMMEQHREIMAKKEASKKKIGMIAVCAGEGLTAIFKDLKVDEIIEGGQTMNPSIEDITNAIDKVNAESVIILPNNSNIIMAAENAAQLVSDKKIFVVPTKEAPQGIKAAFAFDAELSAEENVANMRDSFAEVKCGQVTTAVRNTSMDGFDISEGDIIGLDGKKIVAKGKTPEDVVKDVTKNLTDKFSEVITLYYGSDVKKEDAEALCEAIQDEYDDYDVILYYGGQPHYQYLLSVE